MIVRAHEGLPLTKRLFVFGALWLIAALICATFAEGAVEAGDSAFRERLGVFVATPLVAAIALPYTLGVRSHMVLASSALLLLFIAHAALTLTRTTKRSFLIMCSIQVFLLLVSVVSVLYFYHYEATHGHG
jgi:hypothetical protein